MNSILTYPSLENQSQGLLTITTHNHSELAQVNLQLLIEITKYSQIQIVECQQRIDLYSLAEELKQGNLDVEESLERMLFTRPMSLNQLNKILNSLRIDIPVLITDIFATFNLENPSEQEMIQKSTMIQKSLIQLSQKTMVLMGFEPKGIQKLSLMYQQLNSIAAGKLDVSPELPTQTKTQLPLL